MNQHLNKHEQEQLQHALDHLVTVRRGLDEIAENLPSSELLSDRARRLFDHGEQAEEFLKKVLNPNQ